MARRGKGVYTRDTWDWLGYGAMWALASNTVSSASKISLLMRNIATDGSYLDCYALTAEATVDCSFSVIAYMPNRDFTVLSNFTVMSIDPTQGAPHAEVDNVGLFSGTQFNIVTTQTTPQVFEWPPLGPFRFLRLPTGWGCMVDAIPSGGATTFTLGVTWYALSVIDTRRGAT